MTLALWLRIISTVSTLAIGVAASFLALQQFRLSRSRLKFDLYERRLALFMTVRDFASTYALRGEGDPGKFYRDTIERFFLFDEDVTGYIYGIYEKANKVRQTGQELQRPNLPDVEAEALKKQLAEGLIWFNNQSDNMIKVFSKDMSIKTLR